MGRRSSMDRQRDDKSTLDYEVRKGASLEADGPVRSRIPSILDLLRVHGGYGSHRTLAAVLMETAR